jgi:hypothetical protein
MKRLWAFLWRVRIELAVQIALICIIYYRPFDFGSRALEEYALKWMNVSAAALWAHISRKALFRYMDLHQHIKEGDDPAVLFLAAWYAAWIIGWSLGG